MDEAAGGGRGHPDLSELIRAHHEQTRESYRSMARRSGDQLHHQSLQGWAAAPPKAFPKKRETFEQLAHVLDTDVTTVVLAFACSLGLDVRAAGPGADRVLPPDAERLTQRQRAVLLSVVDVMVNPDAQERDASGRGALRRVARRRERS